MKSWFRLDTLEVGQRLDFVGVLWKLNKQMDCFIELEIAVW
jgi:hypothetical protein